MDQEEPNDRCHAEAVKIRQNQSRRLPRPKIYLGVVLMHKIAIKYNDLLCAALTDYFKLNDLQEANLMSLRKAEAASKLLNVGRVHIR